MVCAWHITIVIAYTSASFVGVHLSSQNLEGTRSSGAKKAADPPLTSDSDEPSSRLGSCTMIMDPKSMRHAATGSEFVIRMLA